MTRNLDRDTPVKRIAVNQRGISNEERKPVLGGPLIYVGDFVAPDDPGNDPAGTSPSSPPWLNGFTYLPGFPLWFAHGVDGETDMGGMYDLVTGSPVSGDIAFMMPNEWANAVPFCHAFPVELATDVWTVAVQKIDPADPSATAGAVPVRIYWPIVATAYP